MLASILRSRLWMGVLGLAVLALSGCFGDSGPQQKRVIFLNNTDSPFWDACRAGLYEGEKEFKLADANLKVAWESNNGKADGQIEKLRQFAGQSDIAAVAISVISADNPAIIDAIKTLRSRGVTVICVDGDVNREKFPDARKYYIGTDNTVGGHVLGRAVRELLKEKGVDQGGYVQFAGEMDNDNARSRMNGVHEILEEAGYTETDRMPDHTKRDKAQDNVRTALNGDPAALIGIWSYNAPAIAEVVTDRKVRDQVVIGCFDAEPAAIDHMSKGAIDVMVVQDPYDMGRQSARLLKAMVTGDEATVNEMYPDPEADDLTFRTGLRVVRPDEGSPLQYETFKDLVSEENFMTLSQFKVWLDKYGLKGS